jgi:CheY-like chemotaxis protein
MGIWQGLLSKLGLDPASDRQPLRVFLLDDDVLRHEWFARRFSRDELDAAFDPAEAVELLSSNTYDAIFLDHDLLPEHYNSDVRDDERTGYAVAEWLAARPGRQSGATVIVHTRNADAALRMVGLMRRAGLQAEHVPFPYLSPKIKNYLGR